MADYDEVTILLIWDNATVIPGRDPRTWRRDAYGNLVLFAAYGNRDDDFGWEIDHIVPVADGGTDDDVNRRALHWRANLARNV